MEPRTDRIEVVAGDVAAGAIYAGGGWQVHELPDGGMRVRRLLGAGSHVDVDFPASEASECLWTWVESGVTAVDMMERFGDAVANAGG